MVRFLIPLVGFFVLAGLLYIGLGQNPTLVSSPFIGKPAPMFSVPTLHKPEQIMSPVDFKGQVWLLNVWASWCVSCRQEHPILMALARSKQVPIYGLNYKDQRKDGIGWLQRFGNPYVQSAFDLEGLVGIDYGVYGVPETFVIDKFGTIRHKVIGPVTTTRIRDCVLPVVKQLEQETAPSTVALAEGFDACKT